LDYYSSASEMTCIVSGLGWGVKLKLYILTHSFTLVGLGLLFHSMFFSG